MKDGTDILLKSLREDEKKICSFCQGELYKLDGCSIETYVCSNCGKTYQSQEENQSTDFHKKNNVPIFKLFSDAFMQKYTEYKSFNDFLSNCNLIDAEVFEDPLFCIEDVDSRKLNNFVKKKTSFSSWYQMFEKAIEWYLHM